MKKYVLQSIRKDNGIVYLKMAPLNQGAGLRFRPGQYATIGFRGERGKLSPMRCFSITSSSNTHSLEFAARIGGDFTSSLAELNVGDEMFVQGPFGDFIIDTKYDKRVVMLAGGIGVTPFMSMIRTATNLNSYLPLTLLYSCRLGRGIPFHDELRAMEARNPHLRVAIFATDRTNNPEIPRMLSGRMTESHIAQVVEGSYSGSTYFICGPKGFTESTESMLLKKGVSADRIITESFTQASKIKFAGYSLSKITYAFASLVLVAGILSIAFLDLSRYLPRHTVSANASTSSQVNSGSSSSTSQPSNDGSSTSQPDSSSSSNTTSDGSTSTSDAGSSANNNTSSSGTSNASSSSSQSSNYQQPTTSVS